jgi:antitoxin ParD1/3/4
MEIHIPEEQQTIIEGLVASGRFASAQEAISEGIRLLVSNERLRQEIQIGIDQADRGEVYDHDTVFAQLKAMATEAQASNG